MQPHIDDIKRHLHHLYAWATDTDCLFEVRCLGNGRPASRRFFCNHAGINAATQFAAAMNEDGRNVYSIVNLLAPGTDHDGTDADIAMSRYQFVDYDSGDLDQLMARLADCGFEQSITVITGTIPAQRMHISWRMASPITDMAAWTETQRRLIAHFGTDRSIINPSRLMRIGGTVSHPSTKKRARGYQTELTRLHINAEASSIDAVMFQTHFPPVPVRADVVDAPTPAEPAQAAQIEGQPGQPAAGDVPLAVLTAAFAVIAPSDDRDLWRDLGMSAKEANLQLGGRAWDVWSRRAAASYDACNQADTWASLKPTQITRARLFAAAKAADAKWWRDGGTVEAWWKDRAAKFHEANSTAAPKNPGVNFPEHFEMNGRGLFYHELSETGGRKPVWICDSFEVIGHTASSAGMSCGLAIRFRKNTAEHEVIIPSETLHKEARLLAATLADMGLKVETGQKQRGLLQTALNHVKTERHITSVKTSGWHRTAKGSWVYVLPDKSVFGDDCDVILASDSASSCKVAGSLEEWKDSLAKYAVGNSRLITFLAAAFVAPLLDIASAESGGLHYHGKSRDGKTTALALASTVWGRGDQFGYVRSWEATSNALEFVAAASCDGLLPLDEIQQAPATQVQGIVYKILNGSGKLRGKPSGGFREAEKWRTFMLSSGEVTPAARITEAGSIPMAGIEVRLINLTSDAGKGMGIFEDLHGFASAADFAAYLLRTAKETYGKPIRKFLTELVAMRNEDDAALIDELRSHASKFIAKNVCRGASGQVTSVAGRFALIAFAGRLAKAYGILPNEMDVDGAASVCFQSWLDERGDTVASETITVVRQVRKFIQANSDARFKSTQEDAYAPVLRDIVGYKHKHGFGQGDGMTYYIMPDQMSEIVPNMTPKATAKILREAGLLVVGPHARMRVDRSFHGQRLSVYELSPAIMSDTETD